MSYNAMGMVDPQGKFHSTNGLSHLDWCQENRALVGFVGTHNGDYEPDESGCFDREGGIALDAFKWAGWIRVKPNQGVEVASIDADNLVMIKKILRDIAKDNPGRTLYVDGDGNGGTKVIVDFRGRPDFSEIEIVGEGHGRYCG